MMARFKRFSEMRNIQCEHGQSTEQARNLFCTCDSGVARCQSKRQCHFWRMNSMFGANCTDGQVSLEVVNQMCVFHEAMNGCKNLKIH